MTPAANLMSGNEPEEVSATYVSLDDHGCAVLYPESRISYIFSDTTLRDYVETNFDTNEDELLCKQEIAAVTSLDISNMGISDLTGIEMFTSLTSLDCSGNNLTSLDVSSNAALTELQCYDNNLTNLDVSNNTALTKLYCYSNQITDLKLDNNIEYIDCHDNKLTSLDVSENTALTYLACQNNNLTTLDTSNNTALIELYCHENQLYTLNVSDDAALQTLWCPKNNLTSLDVTDSTKLRYLACTANNLTNLDVIKNTALYYFDCSNNKIASLDVGNNTALGTLGCSDNQLTDLDVSENTALKKLACQENNLTTLDVSNNRQLETLDCFSNKLSSLDVSNNTALTSLGCQNNNIDNLDVSKNKALTLLHCFSNNLTALDVTNNTALTELACQDNDLINLDVSKNKALTLLHCFSNNLKAINVSNNTVLTELACQDNKLTTLDVSNNKQLEHLECFTNQLTSLDVSNNTALTLLSCNGNNLISLDVSNNTELTELYCKNNNLTSLDLGNNTKITTLKASGNTYNIGTLNTNGISLDSLSGFDITKASNWKGATYDDETGTLNLTDDNWEDGNQYITYDYNVGNGRTVTFELICNVNKSAMTTLTNITPVAESFKNKGDGQITGVTDEMEYRAEGETEYTAVTGDAITGLAVGTYYVRYKESNLTTASDDTKVTITEGPLCKITVPEDTEGYTLTTSKTSAACDEDVTVTFKLNEGYSRDNDFAILNNGNMVRLNSNGTYTFNPTGDSNFTVEGIADLKAPTVKVALGDNLWSGLTSGLSNNLIYKEGQTVNITATDNGSGVKSVEYYLADSELTTDQLLNIADWTNLELTGSGQENNIGSSTATLDVTPSFKGLLYIRATDNNDNVCYVNSDGILIDDTTPAFTGLQEGSAYVPETTVTVDSFSNVSVTANGKGVQVTDNTFSLEGLSGNVTLIAKNIETGTLNSIKIIVSDKGKKADAPDVETVHNFTYTAEGNTITGWCSNCGAVCTASLKTTDKFNPTSFSYTGAAITPYKVAYSDNWSSVIGTTLDIAYTNNTNVGTATASITCGGVKITKNFEITKIAVDAPTTVKATDETVQGKGDGAITGVDTTMEYKTKGASSYTAVTSNTIENLAAGVYYVRYKEQGNYSASENVVVTVKSGPKCKITVPSNQTGYTLKASKSTAAYGDRITLTLKLDKGYSMTDDFAIEVNGEALELDSNNKASFDVTEDSVVTVKGITDVTTPVIKLTIGNNRWTSLTSGISYNLLATEGQTVNIKATYENGGISSVGYYLADKEMTADELAQVTEWVTGGTSGASTGEKKIVETSDDDSYTNYTDSFVLSPNFKGIVYVKVTDTDGKDWYVNSGGILIDGTTPEFVGLQEGKAYTPESVAAVSSFSDVDVYANGEKVAVGDDKTFSLAGLDGEVSLIASNQVGAESYVNIIVNAAGRTVNASAGDTGEATETAHEFSYVADGNTLMAICSGCGDVYKASIGLASGTTSSTFKYTGKAITPCAVTYGAGWRQNVGKTLEIKYTNNKEPGTASGKITAGDATAEYQFKIVKDGLSAATFDDESGVGAAAAGQDKVAGVVAGSETAAVEKTGVSDGVDSVDMTSAVNSSAGNTDVATGTKSAGTNTADDSNMLPWIILMLVSVSGIGVTFGRRRGQDR